MKSRLSFVTRRPSAMPPPSPKAVPGGGGGARGFDSIDDSSPMPEPMTIGGGLTSKSSELGKIMELSPTTLGGVVPSPTSASALASSSSSLTSSTTTVPLKDGESPTNLSSSLMAKSRSKSTVDMKKKLSNGGAEDVPESIFRNSVREGFLKKKGVVNTSWKKRYIVLLPHQLAYYDELPRDDTILPKGFINLTSILRVTHHDVSNCSFDVVTPTRIFRLQADTQADMDAWIASISGTAANEQQILASRKRNVSHAQLRGLTEEDRLKIDDSAKISHENAELSQWPKWSAFDVAAWLQTFGMARYCEAFYNAGVTGEKFKQMDDAMLKSVLGPDSDKADRIKLLAQIKKLVQNKA